MGAEKIILRESITFEDKEITELILDFDKLTGHDLENCFLQLEQTPKIAELDRSFHTHVAAQAANVPVELIRQLKAKDYTRVTVKTQNFLLG